MIPLRDTQPSYTTPIVTIGIILANVAAFFYEISLDQFSLNHLLADRGIIAARFQFSDLLTSMFLHGGWMHILGNMLYLYIFGDNVEDRMGHLRYLLFYFVCGLGASAAHIYFNWGSQLPSVGASGAIAGVLAGYLLLFPRATVRTLLFLGPFITMTRVPAIIMIGFWFVTQLVSGLAAVGSSAQTSGDGVAYWAHIGGFVVGLPLVLLLRQTNRPAAYGYR